MFVDAETRMDMDHHPGPAIAALMKLSFDEEHRHAICTLGKQTPHTSVASTLMKATVHANIDLV